MQTNEKTIYLLAVAVPNEHPVSMLTDRQVNEGSVVQYYAAGLDHLGEVTAVVQTQEGSAVHRWIEAAAPYIHERRVMKIWPAPDPDCRDDAD